jgi:hypothetical protein
VVDVIDLAVAEEFWGPEVPVDPRPRNVLIVGEDFVRRGAWGRWLRRAGFHTATCPGPHVVPGCPRLDGDPCPLREWAHVAVVDVATPEAMELYGGWAERLCTRLPDDQLTLLVHDPEAEIAPDDGRVKLTHPVTPGVLEAAVRWAVS